MKVLAIGDIHRKWSDLSELLNFAESRYDKVVLVGDYADDFFGDAEDTVITWNILLNDVDRDKVIPLIGNHDFAYAYATEIFMLYGRYDIQTGFDFPTLHRVMSQGEITERKLAKNFKVSTEIDGVIYSHAGLTKEWVHKYGENGPKDRLEWVRAMIGDHGSPIWARDVCNSYIHNDGRKQVFGHTTVPTCSKIRPYGVWCIDTFSTDRQGRYIGDRSVLEVVDGEKFRVVPESEWNGAIEPQK